MNIFDSFADALVSAHQTGTRCAPATTLPTTVAEAYHVQSRVMTALGGVAGFKTGATTQPPPLMAPIAARMTVQSGAARALNDRIGIELEVGWKIIHPLPSPDAADFEAALARCVLPVPVIELVDTRLSGPSAEDPIAKLADFQLNAGLVVGPPLADWDGRDFGTVTARLRAGDDVLLDGAASVPGGSALATLGGLVRAIDDHCGGLQLGQVVITGSLHPVIHLREPGVVHGQIEGLGAVSVLIEVSKETE